MEISVKLPVDSDGFIEYECPHCKRIFRLNKNLFNDSEDFLSLYCPYCGLSAKIDSFYTTESVEYFRLCAEQMAIEELSKSFKSLERQTRNSLIKVKSRPIRKTEPRDLKLFAGIDKLVHCDYCDIDYKVDLRNTISYCPYCGDIK